LYYVDNRFLDRVFSVLSKKQADPAYSDKQLSAQHIPAVVDSSNPVEFVHSKKESNSAQISTADDSQLLEVLEATLSFLEDGNLEAALDGVIQVLNVDPLHQKANSVGGAILYGLQQFDTAEPLLYNAITSSNWTDIKSIINLANLFKTRGETELALKTLIKGYTSGNNSAADLTAVYDTSFAEVYLNASDYTKASEWYLSAALKLKTDEVAWLRASSLLFIPENQNLTVAENVLLRAVHENLNNSNLIFHLGLVMYATDRLKEAITFFEQAVRLDQSNIDAVIALATAQHAAENYPVAFDYYNYATQKAPNNPTLLANFALLLKEMGRNEDSTRIANLAYTAGPQEAVVARMMQKLGLVVKEM
jgi:tetratricopeptide (TPR) repeat protein